jgi:hypothetical protein
MVYCRSHNIYLSKSKLFLFLSNSLTYNKTPDILPEPDQLPKDPISRNDLKTLISSILKFSHESNSWYTMADTSFLDLPQFENSFFIQKDSSNLCMPLYIDDTLSDFYDIKISDYVLRYGRGGVWHNIPPKSATDLMITFSPLCLFSYFANYTSHNYDVYLSNAFRNDLFSETLKSFNKFNYKSIIFLSDLNYFSGFNILKFISHYLSFCSDFKASADIDQSSFISFSLTYRSSRELKLKMMQFSSNLKNQFRSYFSLSPDDSQNILDIYESLNFQIASHNFTLNDKEYSSITVSFFPKYQLLFILINFLTSYFIELSVFELTIDTSFHNFIPHF